MFGGWGEVSKFPKYRQLWVFKRPDGRYGAFNNFDGEAHGWIFPDADALAKIITEATKDEIPGIYPLGIFTVWILSKRQMERFHRLARPFEIKPEDIEKMEVDE